MCIVSLSYINLMFLFPVTNVVIISVVAGIVSLLVFMTCLLLCCRTRVRPKVRHYGQIRADRTPEEVPMIINADGSDADDV